MVGRATETGAFLKNQQESSTRFLPLIQNIYLGCPPLPFNLNFAAGEGSKELCLLKAIGSPQEQWAQLGSLGVGKTLPSGSAGTLLDNLVCTRLLSKSPPALVTTEGGASRVTAERRVCSSSGKLPPTCALVLTSRRMLGGGVGRQRMILLQLRWYGCTEPRKPHSPPPIHSGMQIHVFPALAVPILNTGLYHITKEQPPSPIYHRSQVGHSKYMMKILVSCSTVCAADNNTSHAWLKLRHHTLMPVAVALSLAMSSYQ